MAFDPSSQDRMSDFFVTACAHKLWSTPVRLQTYSSYLFKDVPLKNTRALDVGGGSGVFSLYMAAAGAREVVCLEPEGAGSRSGASNRFDAVSEALGGLPARVLPCTFQDFEHAGEPFDVVLLHNSINHLDEDACIALRRDPSARETYRALFHKMANLVSPGGHLLLTDGTPVNLWPLLRLRNPFAPTIEWHKHQPPEVWEELAAEAGFRKCCLTWTTPSSMGTFGRILLGNRLGAFLTLGAFRLHLRKR